MADPAIRIVPATASDLDDIAKLEAASFKAPWRRAFFESELNAAGRYNRVAKTDEGRLVGYLFSMYFLDEMHVNKIAVTVPMRRQGVALRLMEDCILFARANQVRSVSLEVRASNAAAQLFYKRLQFAPTYVRSQYYPDGEAAVVMTAQISG